MKRSSSSVGDLSSATSATIDKLRSALRSDGERLRQDAEVARFVLESYRACEFARLFAQHCKAIGDPLNSYRWRQVVKEHLHETQIPLF